MLKIIFNADDFGISPGVNQSIWRAYHEGILNSTSLMINQEFVPEALEMAKRMPDLTVGLHINLTNERPAADPKDIPHLVGPDGKFKNGFVKLFLLSLVHPKTLYRETKTEIKAQIEKYLATGLALDHLNSHRHVHLIPAIFRAVKELQAEYRVRFVRVMNENAWNTIRQNKSKSWLWDGGLVKYFILRALSFWDRREKETYFYTILYTCKIQKDQFQNVVIPRGYQAVEVMIHPGLPEIDRPHPEYVWNPEILKHWRQVEFETLLDPQVAHGLKEHP